MKVHNHDEQFDTALHDWCGKGGNHHITVTQRAFEATPSQYRCKICERDWFPNGQPDWHFQEAVKEMEK